jgi:phosphopantetheinyl transferase
MPLYQTAIVRPEWVAAQDPRHWLTETELAVLNAWQSPTRRAEWLAGRLAVKCLLRDSLGIASLKCSVGRDGLAPRILGLEQPELVFSLSHSAGLGAATFSDQHDEGSAGIDAQWVRPVHPGLCTRVFSHMEQEQIASHFGSVDDAQGMLLFWALKEAAIKARRQVWGRSMKSIAVQLTDANTAQVCMPDEPMLSAQYEWQNGWWLARAVLPNS